MVILAVCVVCPQMKNVLKNASTANSFPKSLLNSYPSEVKEGRTSFHPPTAIHNLFTIIFEKPIDKSGKVWYNKYNKEREVNEMIIAVIILAWLLVSTWITFVVVGIDEGYKGDEWAGIIVSCLFSPIMVFIIRPIVLAIKRAKKNKKN